MIASYAYSGLGDRLQETVDSVTTTFTMDLNTGLTQALSDGMNTYLYGAGRIAQISGADREYFLGDALGSVRQLTDASGAVTYTASYDPYGNVLSTAGSAGSSYGYTNEYTDSYTDLIYLRSRMYSPTAGRFTTRDEWRGVVQRPMSYNSWLYANDNPIYYIDPSGHCGANWGIGAKRNTEQCNQLVANLEATYNITVYWPGRTNLPNGIPSDISCYCGASHPWSCDDVEWVQADVSYKKWKLEEVIALGTAVIMYQNELGYEATKKFLDGVVFLRGKGHTSPTGKKPGGEYYTSGSLRGFGNSPGIILYDPGFGFQVSVFVHEIAHRAVDWYDTTSCSTIIPACVEYSFRSLVWLNKASNPGTGPTAYARDHDIDEDIAESIMVYLWNRQSSWWLDSIPAINRGTENSYGAGDLTQSRTDWVSMFFSSLNPTYSP